MSHTPGPYIIGEPGGPSGPFYSLVNPQGRVVAMQILNQEDSLLLAAAPDLLAAAQKLINNLPDCTLEWARDAWGNSNTSAVYEARDALRIAIARAKGEK